MLLFLILPVVGAPMASLLIALAAQSSARRLLPSLIMIVSAGLTWILFAALPVYFMLRGSTRPGGLMF